MNRAYQELDNDVQNNCVLYYYYYYDEVELKHFVSFMYVCSLKSFNEVPMTFPSFFYFGDEANSFELGNLLES